MRSDTIHYEIRNDKKSSKSAVRYVTFGSFSAREFPLALWRLLRTREFVIYIGIPVAFLLLAEILSRVSDGTQTASILLTSFAVLWMIAALFYISRFGKSMGIGCFSRDPATDREVLAGALRMKISGRSRLIRIAGILVDPRHRNRGVFIALLLALFRTAVSERGPNAAPPEDMPRISIFAPGHPASRRVVEKYFAGNQDIVIDPRPGSRFMKTLALLEQEIHAVEERSTSYSFHISPTEWGSRSVSHG